MRTRTVRIGKGGSLTSYLWDDSEELAVKKRPAVLVIPGGGYEFCSDAEAEPIALGYVAEGFNAFVLRYSCKTEDFETPFSEAQKALELIYANADGWGINQNAVAVCGFSAGGHLACSLGVMGARRPAAMVLGYPAVVGEDWAKPTHKPWKPFIPDLVSRVDKNTCSAFIFASRDDDVVPINNTISLAAALDKAGVPFEVHIFAHGKHGYSLARYLTSEGKGYRINDAASKWFSLSVDWLKNTIGDVKF